jgi:hypothetical protein
LDFIREDLTYIKTKVDAIASTVAAKASREEVEELDKRVRKVEASAVKHSTLFAALGALFGGALQRFFGGGS